MNSDKKTHLIKATLDFSTAQLSSATLEKLRHARSSALNHQRIHHAAPVLSWIGYRSGPNEHFHFSKSVTWISSLLIAAFLFSVLSLWQNSAAEHEITETDISILTDDMPIHVYVD